jgi:tyrosine-specific transport protein
MTTVSISKAEGVSKGTFWEAAFLISGTCIGGGMLVMPVQAAEAGFVLSAFALLICYLFMTFTGLLLVEATLWVRNETHFSSLSRILVGNGTKLLALLVYLFMNYASLVAYTAGGAQLIQEWLPIFNYPFACLLFSGAFSLIVYVGAKFVGRMNGLLFIIMAMGYCALVGCGIGSIQGDFLAFRPAYRASIGILSMILATFSYQMVVPSICSYLRYDVKQLKRAVILGTTFPCVIYLVWLMIVHGIVPLEGLKQARANGTSAASQLGGSFNHWSLMAISNGFAFLAMTTSYLGLSLALFDFLKDCFGELSVNMSRFFIVLFTFIPTLIISIFFDKALLQCLDISGGYGDTLLSGLIPITMVWLGRYKKGFTSEFKVPGGKLALCSAAAFFFGILLLQFYPT